MYTNVLYDLVSYKAMAKNVFQKKKRVAHFQTVSDEFTKSKNEDELSGCFDYVSSIIDNMDSSFKSMNSDCSKLRAKRKSMSNDEFNTSSLSKPSSSSHKGFSQTQKKLERKFTVSRKFPLMEKSQKILKQIKHNRNISKPRAHLAGLPKSPVKADVERVSSIRKLKKSPQHGNKLEMCSSRLSGISVVKSNDVHKKIFKSDKYKNSGKEQDYFYKEEETITSTNLDQYSGNEYLYDAGNKVNMNASIEKNSLNDTKASKDSEFESSDSEYERFIKKNKKGLRKKVVKKQKLSATKKVKCVKKSTRILKRNRLKQNSSDRSGSNTDNDGPLPKNSNKGYCFKNKITQVHADTHMENSDEESECDMISDAFTQGPSSESDTESNNKTERTQPLKTIDLCYALQKADSMQDSDTGSDATLPDVSVGNKKSDSSHITVDNIVLQSYRPDVSSSVCDSDIGSDATLPDVSIGSEKTAPETSHVTVDTVVSESYVPSVSLSRNPSNSGKTELHDSTSNLVIDLCSDSESEMGVCNEYSSVSAQIDGDKSVKGDLIGFTNNDDNCNNTVCKPITLATLNQEKILIKDVQNLSNIDSEESDIEILDIVPTKPKDECTLNVASNMLCCPKPASSGEVKNEAAENNVISNICDRNSQVVVKTEKLYGTAVVKNNVRADKDNKYEAAYMTNICNDFSQGNQINFNQRTLICSEGRELSEMSTIDVLPKDSVLQKNIKQESESDDDVVLLEPIEAATISDFSSHKRVKTEIPDILVKSLKCVKHSAHKILEMDNHSQNHCDIPQVIKEIKINTKNEHVCEDVSNFKNIFSKECVYPETKNNSSIKGELKLDICSSSSILSSKFSCEKYQSDPEYIDINKMNESHLIELYKKEFDAYQEIVQTEASVSASLKLLEVRQAEKVEYIRSLVQKYVANAHNSCTKDFSKDLASSFSITQTDLLASSKLASDIKPKISNCGILENVQQPTVLLKQEPEYSQTYQNLPEVKSNKKQTLKLMDEKCNVCGKEAMAACQSCAKVFFCSHECGRKFWIDGHVNECGK